MHEKKRFLQIINYNKAFQKKLKISIKDYEEYCHYYSSVEIELKMVENKSAEFINLSDMSEEEKGHYHIYFDDSKEEIKRNFLKENEKVNTIKIILDHQVKLFAQMFYGFNNISSINFKKFHRIDIVNTSLMFSKCSSLREINLTNFKSNNVTNMHHMFFDNPLLKKLNHSNLDTNKVTDMNSLFYGNKSL